MKTIIDELEDYLTEEAASSDNQFREKVIYNQVLNKLSELKDR